MAKKFALVSPLYSFAVQDLMDKILDTTEGTDDIELIQSTPGGNVFSAWALAGFFKDREGKLTVKAYGDCSSMGFFNALYADRVEALDVTQFTIHRADGYVETDDDRLMLDNINKELRRAMEAKLDEAKFTKVTKGKTFDDIFNLNERLNVTITAKQAKQIGLVDKVIPMNDKQVNAFNEKFVAFSDFFDDAQGSAEPQGSGNEKPKAAKPNINNNQKIEKMTVQEIQAQHPEAYAAILALGVKAENDRVGSLLAYNSVDPEAVKKAIASGEAINETFRSEMQVKMISAMKVAEVTAEVVPPVEGSKPVEGQKTEAELAAEKEIEAFKATALSAAGIKKEVTNE